MGVGAVIGGASAYDLREFKSFLGVTIKGWQTALFLYKSSHLPD